MKLISKFLKKSTRRIDMPMFEFLCPDCGKTKEEICRLNESIICHECLIPMKKIMSSPTLGIGKRHLKKGRMPPEMKSYNK